ncbi:MAG TPA: gluconokinase [Cellulomonas sp.]
MSEVEHLVVMGVSGSGKTTVARILAERLDRPFAEADDLHPATNIAKMSAGTPLSDADRLPWLRAIRDRLTAQARAGRSTVVTCSALKVAYRDVLREAEGRVRFVHLTGTIGTIDRRVSARSDHFMPPALLASQFDALEPLTPTEDGVVVPVTLSPEAVADAALSALAATA